MPCNTSKPNAMIRLKPVTPNAILAEHLRRLDESISSTALDGGQRSAVSLCRHLAEGLEGYVEDCTSPASPELDFLARETLAVDWTAEFEQGETQSALESEMLSGHVEGQFLKMLVQISGAKSILEIGLFTGYSALAMAEGLPPEGRLVALEIDPRAARLAGQCFQGSPAGRRIEVVVGDARESLSRLADAGASFDLVFIDADKTGYLAYYEELLARGVLAENGMICVDNTLLQGEPYLRREDMSANGRAIAEFNKRVADDDRVEQVLVPLRDGVTLIRCKG